MTNPFEMRFLSGKGTIVNRLNKSNSRSKRDVSNIGVTETNLKFDGPQRRTKYKRLKQTVNHADIVSTYRITPPPDPEDLGS